MTVSDLFFGTSGPHSADIAIVGESWGSEEASQHKPFVGQSGHELTKILAEAGIARNSCFMTNVVSIQPPENDMSRFFYETTVARKAHLPHVRGLYPTQKVVEGVRRLEEQLKVVNPKIIIGFGNYTLWALTEDNFRIGNKDKKKIPTGIGSWRGSQLHTRVDKFKFLPTYHPAAVMRNWPWRYDAVHDLKARVSRALKGNWDVPSYNFTIRPSFEATLSVLNILLAWVYEAPTDLAIDLETLPNHHIACIGIGWSELDAICIPFRHSDGNYWTAEEEIAIILLLRKLLSHPYAHLIGQNFLFDAQYIVLYWGVLPNLKHDTMIYHHLCWPGKPKGLGYISSLYNNYHCFWKDEGKELHPTFSDDQHWQYNCKDCVNTFEASSHLRNLIASLGLQEQAEFQIEQYHMDLDMMLHGVNIDQETQKELAADLGKLKDEISARLKLLVGEEIHPHVKGRSPWYTSPAQQKEIFYDTLGIKEVLNRGTKKRTVNDEALELIARREPLVRPIVDLIQALRSVRIFKKNYADMVVDPDGRVRCSYDPTGTNTFRSSSSKSVFGSGANLQTLPVGREKD